MKIEIVETPAAIGSLASEWNRLWNESRCPSVYCRAEMVRLFQQHFAPQSRLVAVTLRRENHLLALVPLLVARERGWMKTARFPVNEWSQAGRILAIPREDPAEVSRHLAEGMERMGMGHFWLDWTGIDDRPIRALKSAARQRGWRVQVKPRFSIGLIRLPETHAGFLEQLSKNRRKKIRQQLRDLEQAGPTELEEASAMDGDELQSAFEEALQIELQGWKGRSGSAIASHPAICEYFRESVRLLRSAGLLRLFFLRHRGQRIAFDFGGLAHGVYSSQKISFRESHAAYSPGQVLTGWIIRHLVETRQARLIDTVGPITEATRSWCNDEVRSGRVVMAPGKWLHNPAGHTFVSLLQFGSALRGQVAVSGPESDPALS